MLISLQLPAGPVAELVNHLWQSTIFLLGAWLLTLVLRHNRATTRYRLWMLASIKFLIPFSLLLGLGERIELPMARPIDAAHYAWITYDLAAPASAVKAAKAAPVPIAAIATAPIAKTPAGAWFLLPLAVLWAGGTCFLLTRWAWRWRQLRRTIASSVEIDSASGIPVRETGSHLEPGVFGILHPILLLPRGIRDRLSEPQMEAILAHELCHVRRRDNFTAAVHMLTEAVFWFHPAVWWIGARLIEERERACDEAVVANREAQTYAEGILNVCKFYTEAPMSCVSGVTGSDLKKRMVRIMAQQTASRLDLGRRVLLGCAGMLAIALPVSFGIVHAAAQTAEATGIATGILDTWQGTLHAGEQNLRTVLKFSKDDKGVLQLAFYSIDQGGQPIAASSVSFDSGVLKYGIERIDLTFEGKMSTDGKSITGTQKQGDQSFPIVFERATPATAWSIPEPRKPVPPMPADANPGFEVATIKPAPPDEPGKLFGFNGSRVKTINTTFLDLITFAYGVQQKQVVGGPEWMGTVKWDIDGQPDIPGSPSPEQLRGMFQKLLAERFQLKFHSDKKELSAYLLTVSKTGPKMKASADSSNGLPGLFFRGLGVLTVTNATMGDFCNLMQEAVLDRPVVDQTALTGRYDFLLKWTPDESQFGGMGIKVPPPSDAADAPPPLFTALPEQTGLKLDAGKAQVKVLVMDKVEKPSDN